MAPVWYAVLISFTIFAAHTHGTALPDNGLKTFSASGSHAATEQDGGVDAVILDTADEVQDTGYIGHTSKNAPRSISYTKTDTEAADEDNEADTSTNADTIAYAKFEDNDAVDDVFGSFDWPSAEVELDLSVDNPDSGDTDDDNTEWVTKKTSKKSSTVTVRKSVLEDVPGQAPKVKWIEATANAETEGTVCTGSGESEFVKDCQAEGSKAKATSYTTAQSGEINV